VTIRTEMTARVYEALAREGIEIPFPQQDLHLRSVDPAAGQRLAGGHRAEQDASRPT
jgi:potassium-dependent mechanosensitive channel